ncbi:MAG: RNA polymerase ECF-type sigma factor [uncultured Corynebacteriales bacterium]|uniref:RNA polymerase ECF-type sigma factor n=1 Tax=uncultured Mycobacteriales bacterium TaxID=581187 RepID=A0A6J4JNQ2_9ACTN|nr:MAG: RNA polymerase ECF-type sigma factor [uncultured Corynebacteriales bacterium]
MPTAHPHHADEVLLAAVGAGDRAAFEVFYRRHAGWLLIRLDYRTPEDVLVDDVVQETFLSVWRGAARYRSTGDGDVTGWLWRIASRRLTDALRQRSSRARLGELLRGRPPGVEPSAEDRALGGLEHGDLAAAVAALTPDLQAVLRVTVLDGLTTQEAASVLGIPPGTVKTRSMRARAALRRELRVGGGL